MGQFTPPRVSLIGLRDAVRRVFWRDTECRVVCAAIGIRSTQLGDVPGKDRSPLRFTYGLKLRITETASGYARRQYRATLQASFIHRLFLRCGRIHSGEERNTTRISRRIYSSQKRRSAVSNKTAVNVCNYFVEAGRITRTSVRRTYPGCARYGDPTPRPQSKRIANVLIQSRRVVKEIASL